MKSLVLADIQSLHFETQRDKIRIDFVEFMNTLKTGAFDIRHAIAYTQPTSEPFERLLSNCGFEVIVDKSCHTHRLCMDALTLAPNYEHVIFMSTRYYLQPLVTQLKRMGKKISIFGYNTPAHIKSLADYYDIDILQKVTGHGVNHSAEQLELSADGSGNGN